VVDTRINSLELSGASGGFDGILCFGDNDWWYHNRGHMDIQLMKRYARLGRVLYVNSIVVRKLNIQEGAMFLQRVNRKLRSIMRGMKPSGIENMTVYSPISMPVHHINFARQLNTLGIRLQISRGMRKMKMVKPIIWVACPGAAEVALTLPHMKLVYQRSDCYEEFPCVDANQIRIYDKLMKKHADLVVYANKQLLMREERDCRKAIYVDHGVDYELFANAHENPYIPAEMKLIPHPILGFYGGIDAHTSNISLIEDVADLLPDISVVLIGNASVNLNGLRSRKNVYLLPQKPYEEIPHYAKCFDVCFMPWQQNNWIAACNPVKLKEYLALGKPIVSTTFSELTNYNGLVNTSSDAQSFAHMVRKVLEENNSELTINRRRRVVEETWDAKSQVILRTLFQMPL
jgi:glycosyltransferase involved in cell wall biosynthesis